MATKSTSGSQRLKNFRSRQVKEVAVNSEKQNQDLRQMFQMFLALAGRVYKLEDQMKGIFNEAKIAYWRSFAIMDVLDKTPVQPNGITLSFPRTKDIVERAIELQAKQFDIECEVHDQVKNLIPSDGPAEQDDWAIVNVKVFKGGNHLELEEVPKSKIQIGQQDLFPELDDAIKGMKVGEVKDFPLSLKGQTDSARVTLLGLRRASPPPSAPGPLL